MHPMGQSTPSSTLNIKQIRSTNTSIPPLRMYWSSGFLIECGHPAKKPPPSIHSIDDVESFRRTMRECGQCCQFLTLRAALSVKRGTPLTSEGAPRPRRPPILDNVVIQAPKSGAPASNATPPIGIQRDHMLPHGARSTESG